MLFISNYINYFFSASIKLSVFSLKAFNIASGSIFPSLSIGMSKVFIITNSPPASFKAFIASFFNHLSETMTFIPLSFINLTIF